METKKRYFKLRQRVENLLRGGEVYALYVAEHFPKTEDITDEQARYPIRVWFTDTFPLGEVYMKVVAQAYVDFLRSFAVYQIVMDRTVTDDIGKILEHVILLNEINDKESFS